MSASREVSKQSLFTQPVDAETHACHRARELLTLVQQAKYDEIEATWKEHPQLMLARVIDSKKRVITTPLKQSFFNGDTYTWKPYYEFIKVNHPELVQEFLWQKAEQMRAGYIDDKYLEPLYREYENWRLLQLESFKKDSKVTEEELDQQWEKVFQQQNHLMPMNMIREMVREDAFRWSHKAFIMHEEAPKGGTVNFGHNTISIDSDDFQIFGTGAGLVRGRSFGSIGSCRLGHHMRSLPHSDNVVDSFEHDSNAIRALCYYGGYYLKELPEPDFDLDKTEAPGLRK